MNLERTVIALGFFDGVHRGHGALLQKTVQRAGELGAIPAVFTFDRPPKEVVTGRPMPLINSPEDRADLARRIYGIQQVILAPFDEAMMTMPWQDFITELLVKRHGAVHLVAGHDYHFGYKNQGDPRLLQEKCRELGIGCDIIPKVELEGVTVSSTYIRTLVDICGVLILTVQHEQLREAALHSELAAMDEVLHRQYEQYKRSKEGIRLINESMPSDAVIKLKSLEAFAAAADGRATKIIIPSEIQGVAALAAGLVESVKGDAPNA